MPEHIKERDQESSYGLPQESQNKFLEVKDEDSGDFR